MQITDFLQGLGRPVAYYPSLTAVTGGVKETIFLCQLIWWHGKQRSEDGWIYKTQEELREETGLSRTEQESSRKTLKERHFLEERYSGMPRKLFYRIRAAEINRVWQAHAIMQETCIQECGKPAGMPAGNPQANNKEYIEDNIDDSIEVPAGPKDPAAEIRPISAPFSENLNNNNSSSEEPVKNETPSETGPSSSEKGNPPAAETCPAGPAPDLSTTRKCLEFVSQAKNKSAAIYICLARNFPEGNFPLPGEKRECPLIGRVGLMAKKYSWARVLEEMGHARVDLDAGRIVAGDLLGWIDGRLKGGRNGGTGKNRQHPVEDAAGRETGAFNQSHPYDPGDPNDPWSKFREVSGDADGPDA